MSISQYFPSSDQAVAKIIVAVLLLALSPSSNADCKSSTEKVIKALNDYPGSEVLDWGTYVECKVWPADPTKTIAALVDPHKVSNISPSSDDGRSDLEVLVLETSSGNILQRLFQKGALISDAIPLMSIQLDTARYVLAPGVIAFGVRANRYGRFDNETQDINLYAIQENKLKQILDNLTMHESAIAMNDESNAHTCQSSDITRTLAIAKTSSHGYADLIVQENKSERSDGSRDDCADAKTTKSSRQYVLHFDGSSYVLPKELHDD